MISFTHKVVMFTPQPSLGHPRGAQRCVGGPRPLFALFRKHSIVAIYENQNKKQTTQTHSERFILYVDTNFNKIDNEMNKHEGE